MTMTPENLPLGNLFSDRIPFVVPIYQRAYAWEKEEIDDFVSDIGALYQGRLAGDEQMPSHFFGGVVSVYNRIPGTKTGGLYELVDGQQRMATFVLALSLIMEGYQSIAIQANQEGDEATRSASDAHLDVDSTSFLYYEEVHEGKKQQRLRLRLSRADHPFFQQLLDGHHPAAERASHGRLLQARESIAKNLLSPIVDDGSASASTKLERLRALLSAITDDCFVIHIVSDDRSEAYRLFAILNDRGRSLTDGDLLRTRTLELLEDRPDLQEQVDGHWNSVLAGSSSEVDGFLRAFFASVIGKRAPSRDLFDAMTAQFLPFSEPMSDSDAEALARWVKQLQLENEAYLRLRGGQWPFDEPQASAWERDRLHRLVNVLGRAGDIPLLLSASMSKDEEFFSALVQVLERLDFRYLIVGGHPGSLAERYMVHAARIRQAPGKYRLKDLLDDAGAFVVDRAPDDLFASVLPEAVRYTRGAVQNRRTRHFLTTVDDFIGWVRNNKGGEPVPNKIAAYDLNQIDIEHIHPQKPAPGEADPDLDQAVHTLGNLSFWGPSDNKAASNSDFDTKKGFYKDSSVTITRELADLETWNVDIAKERQDSLVDAALAIYQIPSVDQ